MGKNAVKLWLVVFIVGLMTSILLSGCLDLKEEPSGTPGELKGTIKVSGAWALYPMMVKWAEEFQRTHPDVRIDISAGGAGKGMADVLGAMVDIGMVSRELYPAELEKGALGVAVTKDAVVPTVNEHNPVLDELLRKGVTKQTFVDLWVTRRVDSWGDVAGTNAMDEIHVYTRSDACGAAQTWAEFCGDFNQEDLRGVAVYGDPGVSEAVRQDTLGIGFNNLNFAYDANTGKPVAGIKILPIDLNGNGHLDVNEAFYGTKYELVHAIATGLYPSPPARDLYLVTSGTPTGLTKEFIRWCLAEGQQFVSETGYVPLSNETLDKERVKIV